MKVNRIVANIAAGDVSEAGAVPRAAAPDEEEDTLRSRLALHSAAEGS